MDHQQSSARTSLRAPAAPSATAPILALGRLGLVCALTGLGCLPLEDLGSYSQEPEQEPLSGAGAATAVITSGPTRPDLSSSPSSEPAPTPQRSDGGVALAEEERPLPSEDRPRPSPPEKSESADAGAVPPPLPAPGCAEGIEGIEGGPTSSGSCYGISRQRLPWDEALAVCQRWGGSLVSINSADEDALLASTLNVTVWIGASDRAREGNFVWANGEPFLFERFAAGEPNDAFNVQDCVERRVDGSWGDRACSVDNFFVCERALAP